jgi:hypothetical protein
MNQGTDCALSVYLIHVACMKTKERGGNARHNFNCIGGRGGTFRGITVQIDGGRESVY